MPIARTTPAATYGGESPGSIAHAAAMFPLLSGRSTSRAGRLLGLLGGSGSQVPPLASCGSVFVATRRHPHDGPPGAQERPPSNSQHGASPPKTAREAGWLVAALLSSPRCLGTRGIGRPDGSMLSHCCMTASALAGHALDCPIRAPMSRRAHSLLTDGAHTPGRLRTRPWQVRRSGAQWWTRLYGVGWAGGVQIPAP
jgi:hypothetical protein